MQASSTRSLTELQLNLNEYAFAFPRLTLATPYLAGTGVVLAHGAWNVDYWGWAVMLLPVLVSWFFAGPRLTIFDMFFPIVALIIAATAGFGIAGAAGFAVLFFGSVEASSRIYPYGRIDKHGNVKLLTKEEDVRLRAIVKNRYKATNAEHGNSRSSVGRRNR